MPIRILIIATCLGFGVWGSSLHMQAAIYDYYFEGIIPATSAEPSKQEIALALQQVLLRIGNVAPNFDDPYYKDLIESASNLVRRFGITTLPESTESYFIIEFDPSIIQGYFRDNKNLVWGIDRPRVIWVEAEYKENGNLWILDNERDIQSEQKNLLRKKLIDYSLARGISLQFPMGDLEDMEALANMTKTGDVHAVTDFFMNKYHQDGVVVGYRERIGVDQIVEKWFHSGYYSGQIKEEIYNYEPSELSDQTIQIGSVRDEVFMNVADIYFDVLAQQPRSNSRTKLIIKGVADIFAFKESTNVIYSTFDEVELISVEYGELEFEVSTSLGVEWIRNAFEKTNKFQPLTQSAAKSITPVIVYKFLSY